MSATKQSKRQLKKIEKSAEVPDYMKIHQSTNVIFSAIFIFIALIAILPAAFCLIISLTKNSSLAANGYSFIPKEWSFEAYSYLWNQRKMIGNAFVISVVVTVLGTLLGLWLNGTMAYSVSRPNFRLRKLYSIIFMLIPMVFSGGMVGSYLVVGQLFGLRNNIFAMVLPLACSAWNVLVMRTFFQTTVPDSLIESGKIDGASQLRIFFNIVLPISLPVIATIGLLLVFTYWNDWLQASLYIDSNHTSLYPLQYVLTSMQKNIEFLAQNPLIAGIVNTADIPSDTVKMAIVMVVVLPVACAYPFFQRYFVGGLTIGAVKG